MASYIIIHEIFPVLSLNKMCQEVENAEKICLFIDFLSLIAYN